MKIVIWYVHNVARPAPDPSSLPRDPSNQEWAWQSVGQSGARCILIGSDVECGTRGKLNIDRLADRATVKVRLLRRSGKKECRRNVVTDVC